MHGPWCITGEEERDQLWGFSLFTILFGHQLCIECLFYISHLDIGETKSLFHLGGYSFTRRISKVNEQALTDVSSRTWERSGLMAVAINTIHWWRWNGQKCHLRQCAGHYQLTLPFPSVYCIQSLRNQKCISLSRSITAPGPEE